MKQLFHIPIDTCLLLGFIMSILQHQAGAAVTSGTITSIVPNPIKVDWSIACTLESNEQITVTYATILGEKLGEEKFHTHTGKNVLTPTYSFLNSGTYLVTITTANRSITKVVVVER